MEPVYMTEIVLDPPIDAPEFGEWKGDPNVALKDKHDYVYVTVVSSSPESARWAQRMILELDRTVEEE